MENVMTNNKQLNEIISYLQYIDNQEIYSNDMYLQLKVWLQETSTYSDVSDLNKQILERIIRVEEFMDEKPYLTIQHKIRLFENHIKTLPILLIDLQMIDDFLVEIQELNKLDNDDIELIFDDPFQDISIVVLTPSTIFEFIKNYFNTLFLKFKEINNTELEILENKQTSQMELLLDLMKKINDLEETKHYSNNPDYFRIIKQKVYDVEEQITYMLDQNINQYYRLQPKFETVLTQYNVVKSDIESQDVFSKNQTVATFEALIIDMENYIKSYTNNKDLIFTPRFSFKRTVEKIAQILGDNEFELVFNTIENGLINQKKFYFFQKTQFITYMKRWLYNNNRNYDIVNHDIELEQYNGVLINYYRIIDKISNENVDLTIIEYFNRLKQFNELFDKIKMYIDDVLKYVSTNLHYTTNDCLIISDNYKNRLLQKKDEIESNMNIFEKYLYDKDKNFRDYKDFYNMLETQLNILQDNNIYIFKLEQSTKLNLIASLQTYQKEIDELVLIGTPQTLFMKVETYKNSTIWGWLIKYNDMFQEYNKWFDSIIKRCDFVILSDWKNEIKQELLVLFKTIDDISITPISSISIQNKQRYLDVELIYQEYKCLYRYIDEIIQEYDTLDEDCTEIIINQQNKLKTLMLYQQQLKSQLQMNNDVDIFKNEKSTIKSAYIKKLREFNEMEYDKLQSVKNNLKLVEREKKYTKELIEYHKNWDDLINDNMITELKPISILKENKLSCNKNTNVLFEAQYNGIDDNQDVKYEWLINDHSYYGNKIEYLFSNVGIYKVESICYINNDVKLLKTILIDVIESDFDSNLKIGHQIWSPKVDQMNMLLFQTNDGIQIRSLDDNVKYDLVDINDYIDATNIDKTIETCLLGFVGDVLPDVSLNPHSNLIDMDSQNFVFDVKLSMPLLKQFNIDISDSQNVINITKISKEMYVDYTTINDIRNISDSYDTTIRVIEGDLLKLVHKNGNILLVIITEVKYKSIIDFSITFDIIMNIDTDWNLKYKFSPAHFKTTAPILGFQDNNIDFEYFMDLLQGFIPTLTNDFEKTTLQLIENKFKKNLISNFDIYKSYEFSKSQLKILGGIKNEKQHHYIHNDMDTPRLEDLSLNSEIDIWQFPIHFSIFVEMREKEVKLIDLYFKTFIYNVYGWDYFQKHKLNFGWKFDESEVLEENIINLVKNIREELYKIKLVCNLTIPNNSSILFTQEFKVENDDRSDLYLFYKKLELRYGQYLDITLREGATHWEKIYKPIIDQRILDKNLAEHIEKMETMIIEEYDKFYMFSEWVYYLDYLKTDK